MKVAFFGGSFNPPHVGHVLAASYARSVGFDKVLVVVVNQHVFSKELVAFDHRVMMASIAFSQISGVEVSRIEESLPAPNYTLHTLRALAEHHPQWQMRLLIGGDVVADTADWHAFDEVRRIAPPFLLGRGGHPDPASANIMLPEVSSTEVRARLERGAPTDTEWLTRHVPSEVLHYVRAQGLYGANAPHA